MASTAYVIQKIGYEYNDETYHRPECGGGRARHVFFDLKEAAKFCQRMN